MAAILSDPHRSSERGAARPRRILVVVHGYPPRQNSGGEAHTRRKARWWHEHGHDVYVLAADPQPSEQWPFTKLEEQIEQVDGITVHRLRFANPDARRSLVETYRHPLLAAALERVIAQVRPDLLYQVSGYIFGTLPLELAASAGIPAVLFAVDYWHVCQRITLLRPDGTCCPGPLSPSDCAACRLTDRKVPAALGPGIQHLAWRGLATGGKWLAAGPLVAITGGKGFTERRRAITAALQSVALVIASSRFLARQLERLGVPAERILVMRQGIETAELVASPGAATRPGEPLRVLYLGQVSYHKGADLVIGAVARLRAQGLSVHLTLHGPLTDRARYSSQLKKTIKQANHLHGEHIRLGPDLPRPLLASAISAADVLVAPSRWYDNSPNVILEAFALGVPVVTANHGGMAEMVRDGVDGLLFTPGDAGSLAASLRRLGTEPDLLPRLRGGVRRPHGLATEMEPEDAALDRICGATAPGTAR